jgi:hypothetical protein
MLTYVKILAANTFLTLKYVHMAKLLNNTNPCPKKLTNSLESRCRQFFRRKKSNAISLNCNPFESSQIW